MAAVVPYALSVHGFIDKVGADAGFAAIIGVALVVIMLFVHARETASLRTRAEDAEDRVEYLERAVEQLGRVATQATQLAQAAQAQSGHARPGVAAAPAAARTATAARPVPAPAVAAAYAGAAAQPRTLGPPPQLPAAPFMTGGPALSSATRLLPEPGAASSNGHVNGTAVVPPPAPAPAPSVPPASPAAPGPSTVAAGAPTPMPQIPSLPRPSDPRGDTEPPRSRQADTGSRAPRRNYGHVAETKSASRRIVPVLAAVLLVAVIAVAAVLVLNRHHSKGAGRSSDVTHTRSSTTTSTTKSGKKHKRAVTVDPRSVTVAVLNGTTTANFAADISQRLGKLGFQQGKTANFSSSTLTTTTIGFVPGNRPQALAVAKALKVKYSNVVQVNPTTKQLVCPATGACADDVFVVLGTDLASSA
jgi:hypothetical protein